MTVELQPGDEVLVNITDDDVDVGDPRRSFRNALPGKVLSLGADGWISIATDQSNLLMWVCPNRLLFIGYKAGDRVRLRERVVRHIEAARFDGPGLNPYGTVVEVVGPHGGVSVLHEEGGRGPFNWGFGEVERSAPSAWERLLLETE